MIVIKVTSHSRINFPGRPGRIKPVYMATKLSDIVRRALTVVPPDPPGQLPPEAPRVEMGSRPEGSYGFPPILIEVHANRTAGRALHHQGCLAAIAHDFRASDLFPPDVRIHIELTLVDVLDVTA